MLSLNTVTCATERLVFWLPFSAYDNSQKTSSSSGWFYFLTALVTAALSCPRWFLFLWDSWSVCEWSATWSAIIFSFSALSVSLSLSQLCLSVSPRLILPSFLPSFLPFFLPSFIPPSILPSVSLSLSQLCLSLSLCLYLCLCLCLCLCLFLPSFFYSTWMADVLPFDPFHTCHTTPLWYREHYSCCNLSIPWIAISFFCYPFVMPNLV